jgi:gliding motility-associated-like protein
MTSEPAAQYYMIPINRDNFSVKLLVKDTAGCADSTYHLVKVADNCYIAVPSAFTPNNDGKNDFLFPLNAYKATHLTFRVFNRVGQLVFETRDWTRKWDGKMSGIEQAPGVYVWMLDYTDVSKKRISLKGTTVLIR